MYQGYQYSRWWKLVSLDYITSASQVSYNLYMCLCQFWISSSKGTAGWNWAQPRAVGCRTSFCKVSWANFVHDFRWASPVDAGIPIRTWANQRSAEIEKRPYNIILESLAFSTLLNGHLIKTSFPLRCHCVAYGATDNVPKAPRSSWFPKHKTRSPKRSDNAW